MSAAERLFADSGIAAVSARQIGEAAGQGNTAAVGYHFGTKTGLIQAIIRRHTGDIERIRARLATEAAESGQLRDWIGAMVRPSTDHLASLGAPTWFARFAVQVLADPQLRPLLLEETFATPTLGEILRGMDSCLAGLPAPVRAERDNMAHTLILHVVARHERLLAEAVPSQSGPSQSGPGQSDGAALDAAASWHDAATGLVDALTGLFTAPATSRGDDPPYPPMRGR
jgi:AcrR family transcriptional regulator